MSYRTCKSCKNSLEISSKNFKEVESNSGILYYSHECRICLNKKAQLKWAINKTKLNAEYYVRQKVFNGFKKDPYWINEDEMEYKPPTLTQIIKEYGTVQIKFLNKKYE